MANRGPEPQSPESRKTPGWVWIVVAIVALFLVVGLFAIFAGEREPDPPVDRAPEQIVLESPELDAYGSWLTDQMEATAPENVHEMAASGFEHVADAAEELLEHAHRTPDPDDAAAGTSGVDAPEQQRPATPLEGEGTDARAQIESQIDSVRADVERLRDTALSLQHSAMAHAAAMTTADILDQLEQRFFAEAEEEVGQARQDAREIDATADLAEQRPSLEQFFWQTYTAMQAMELRSPTIPFVPDDDASGTLPDAARPVPGETAPPAGAPGEAPRDDLAPGVETESSPEMPDPPEVEAPDVRNEDS
ncbi:MAG: hypothetical protein ACOCTG_03220 [Bacteroidota bacterium]